MKKQITLLFILFGCFGSVYAVNMPSGNSSINVTNNITYYDNGGTGNYSNDFNGTVTFIPRCGEVIRLVFTVFDTEGGWDDLTITGFGTYDGTDSPGTIIATALNGRITMTFDSDGSFTEPGFQCTVSSIPLGSEGGQISSGASACTNATTSIGPGAYQDILLAANTWYNFSWANNSGGTAPTYCARVISGGAGATSTTFSGGTTNNWFSGTTAPVIRVIASRSSTTWSATSAVLTYRHSTPSTPTVSGGGTFCASTANVSSSAIAVGYSYWQNTTNNGTSTASTTTPQSVGATGTYRYRGGNNGCWGTQGSATVTLNSPNTAPTGIAGTATICAGNSVTLTKTGGTGTAEWFTGSCGGTAAGTGNSINVSPTVTTTYYVRSAAIGSCPATACVNGDITLPSQVGPLGNNAESATCTVTENNWIHFYHSSGRLLASVNSAGQNLGNVTVTSYVDGTNALIDACDAPGNTGYQTSVMQRHWVITPSIQPVTPVQVRLPFTNGELGALGTASNANGNASDNVAGIGNVVMTKYTGPSENNNFPDNCPFITASTGVASIYGQTASGVTTAYSTVAGAQYIDYTIPGFSEFWLHGQTNNSPLPVELTSFTAECPEDGKTELNWVTASEHNASHFIIEKSVDASNWKDLETVNAAGNSTTTNYYSVIDEYNRGTNYYRLSQVDVDGTTKVYGQVASKCKSNGLGFSLFPNPAKSMVTLELNQKIENENAYVGFYDVNGKIIKQVDLHSDNGNLMYVDVQDLMPGYYIVRMFNGQNENQPIRFVKQ